MLADGSLKYVTRVEAGSRLKGGGGGSADVGPSILLRYGVDGARFGEAGKERLVERAAVAVAERRAHRREMCDGIDKRLFFRGEAGLTDSVLPVTLTSYVWEALGHPMPKTIYE